MSKLSEYSDLGHFTPIWW